MPDTATKATALLRSLMDAMETTAFVSLNPVEGEPAMPERPVIASIHFCSPAQGRIELAAGESLGALLASNVLLCDTGDAAAQHHARDALGELLNITCGNYVVALNETGADAMEIDVTLPQVCAMESAEWLAFLSSGAAVFDADGHTIAIRLR